MRRWICLTVATLALGGCAHDAPTSAPSSGASPDAFVGQWRSVTPSLEFIRISIASKSSEQGAFATRVTLSGLALEGSGRIEGEALVIAMNVAGSAQSSGSLVARPADGGVLRVQLRPAGAPPTDLAFVRED